MKTFVCKWSGVSCTKCGKAIEKDSNGYADNADQLRNGGGSCEACIVADTEAAKTDKPKSTSPRGRSTRKAAR